jgi:phage terminase small subunit
VPLKPQHADFLNAYLKNGHNSAAAARTAGYSEHTAVSQGSRLLKRADIQAALHATQVKTEKKLALTAERIMSELADIALLDPASMYDPVTGNLLAINKMPESTRRAIASVEHDKGFTKLRMNSKLTALELAAKILNMTKNDQVAVAITTVLLQDKPVSELPVIDQTLLKPEW